MPPFKIINIFLLGHNQPEYNIIRLYILYLSQMFGANAGLFQKKAAQNTFKTGQQPQDLSKIVLKPAQEKKDSSSKFGNLFSFNSKPEEPKSLANINDVFNKGPFIAPKQEIKPTVVSQLSGPQKITPGTQALFNEKKQKTNQQLYKLIVQLQQKSKQQQKNYQSLKTQFEDYKKANENFQASKSSLNINQSLLPQLLESISTMKKVNEKKDLDLAKAVSMIENLTKIIEKQTQKIDSLEKNVNKSAIIPLSSMPYYVQPQMQFNQSVPQNNNTFMANNSQWGNNTQSLLNNPLSRSAVFDSNPPSFSSNPISPPMPMFKKKPQSTVYQEDGYIIKYNRLQASNLFNFSLTDFQVSNRYGVIEVLQAIPESQVKGIRITNIFRINEYGCEIVDSRWENKKLRLTTYNFMNYKNQLFIQKATLQNQVKIQAEKNGLKFVSLNQTSGDLILETMA